MGEIDEYPDGIEDYQDLVKLLGIARKRIKELVAEVARLREALGDVRNTAAAALSIEK